MSALWTADSRTTGDRTEAYAAALYERHHSAVFRHCLKQLRRREDADDAVQTTFVYALLSLRRGVVPRTELAWLYTIAGNVCSSNRRAWLRRGPLEAAQDVDSLQDVIPTPDRDVPVSAEDFRSALGSMPPVQRDALLLREWQGLSYNEIAEKLGLSQAATETTLFRARRTLARKLADKAGVGTIHGIPFAPLIRSLLQSGAGKALAVAVGATAIAVTPAAEHQTGRAISRAAVVAPRTNGREPGSFRQSSSVRIHHSSPGNAAGGVSTADRSVDRTEPRTVLPIGEAAGDPVGRAPETAAAPPTPQPAAAAEPPGLPLDGVVTTVADTVPTVEVPSIPPVTDVLPPLPEVQLPPVPLPVSTPPLPTG